MAEVVSGISDSVVISVLFSVLAVFSDAPDVWQAQKVISAAMGAISSERIAGGQIVEEGKRRLYMRRKLSSEAHSSVACSL